LGLEELVRFAAFVPPLQAPLAANAHDIGISHRRADNENLRLSLPNKLFDYLGGGLAILSSDLPSVREIVAKHDCGTLFEPTGPEAIAEAVLAMSSDLDRLWEMKRNALGAWEEYSWPRQGEKLVRTIGEILMADTQAP
jgi:glycosyltransferase involved in cell wall biosynthesis